MTDAEKAQRLLDRASRVLTCTETDMCKFIAQGIRAPEAFRQLCERLAEYLKP